MVYWNQPKGLTTDGCHRWAQASQLCVEAWRDRKVRNGVVGQFMWYKAAYVFLHAYYVIWSLQWDIISMEMRQRASQRSVCEWSLPKGIFDVSHVCFHHCLLRSRTRLFGGLVVSTGVVCTVNCCSDFQLGEAKLFEKVTRDMDEEYLG